MIAMLLDTFGDPNVLASAGFLIGILFGVSAQHSRFCLRAATIEVYERRPGDRMSIWLMVFFSALAVTQASVMLGVLDPSASRQLAARGSMSGAIIGGLMFGVGMILARGCASRLLVLSATGNMRALVTGLILTLVAQASYRGALAPLREELAGLWTIAGGSARDLRVFAGIGTTGFLGLALAGFAGAVGLAGWSRVSLTRIIAAFGTGLAVALGWIATYSIAQVSFSIVPVASITFTGPSTDTLMELVAQPTLPLKFGIGLVPGVFVGSGIMALANREAKLQRFGPDTPMERYLLGAVLMGFGAMLAGGCAVGAAVSGGAVLSLTAWVAGASMWTGAMAIQLVMDLGRRRSAAAA